MGEPKLLMPWGDAGRPLIEQVLAAWRAGGATHTIVTVHPSDVRLAEVCRAAGAEVVVPAAPPPDMKASIAAAVGHVAARHTPTDDDVWLFAPADLPDLSPQVIARLLEASRQGGRMIRPRHAGRFGHPTLLRWSCVAELDRVPSDRGLDWLFEHVPFTAVEAGPECLAADVDTPDDYRRLRGS
jgi:molybdenum cofactor cytidylyltransferase